MGLSAIPSFRPDQRRRRSAGFSDDVGEPLVDPLVAALVLGHRRGSLVEAVHGSLCYFLLRPAFRKRPAIALACAMLFSAIIFGLGHAGTFQERFLMTGLLYGLPLAVTFARRDWEHAVGAHYMVNMIPLFVVYLEML